MDAQGETRRILARLRLWIFLSDLTQQEIERRAGFSRGYLSQLLGGHVEAKYRQVLAVLAAMELDPADFFAEVFPRDGAAAPRSPLAPDLRRRHRGDRPLALDLARLFGFGLETVDELRRRLGRCEAALDELRGLGYLD